MKWIQTASFPIWIQIINFTSYDVNCYAKHPPYRPPNNHPVAPLDADEEEFTLHDTPTTLQGYEDKEEGKSRAVRTINYMEIVSSEQSSNSGFGSQY